jgi:hypothetical protein
VILVQFADTTLTVAAQNSLNEYIALLYQGALGRTPDAAGLASWEHAAGALPAATQAMGADALSDASCIAAAFTGSSEFQATYGNLTNAQFVTQLYANFLDRAPDAAGYAAWMSGLAAGITREHVLMGFVGSAEAISNATMGYTGQHGTHSGWLFLV